MSSAVTKQIMNVVPVHMLFEAFAAMSYIPARRTTTLTDLLGTQDVSKEVAKLEGRIFQLYGHNQVNWRTICGNRSPHLQPSRVPV